MPLSAPTNLKINQIYAHKMGRNPYWYAAINQTPPCWLAVSLENNEAQPHDLIVQTAHQPSLKVTTQGYLAPNNPGTTQVESVVLPSGTTQALIPFMPSVVTYSDLARVIDTIDAIILRAYVTTATQQSSVASLVMPIHCSLLSVTTAVVTVGYVANPYDAGYSVTVGNFVKLDGSFNLAGTYSAATAYMPGYPAAVSATATQVTSGDVVVNFGFRGSIMSPASAPGIIPAINASDYANPVASFPYGMLPIIYELRVVDANGGIVGAPPLYARPSNFDGSIAVTVPASYFATGSSPTSSRLPFTLQVKSNTSHPQQIYTPQKINTSWNGSFQDVGSDNLSVGNNGNGIYFSEPNLNVILNNASAISAGGINLLIGFSTQLVPQTAVTFSMGSASGVSVPAALPDVPLVAYNENRFSSYYSVVSTPRFLTLTSGGGEGTQSMFSWLNNDYWYLTDLQVNLGTRAVTHRHGTVQIKPNDTVQFAVLFHDGSAGKDPVATDLRLAVRSSNNASSYYFWGNPSVTTTSVSGDIYYTITVTASDEDLLAAQALNLTGGGVGGQILLAEVQWTTTRGTFTSDTFTIEVPSEVIREPDV